MKWPWARSKTSDLVQPIAVDIAENAAPWLRCLLLVGLAAVYLLSDDVAFMVRGSDAASLVFAPSAFVQAASIALVAACLLVPVAPRLRAALIALGFAAALLGGHRLVIDNLHGETADVYLLVPVQTSRLEGAGEGFLSAQGSFSGFLIGWKDAGLIWVLSPPVLGFDEAAVARLAT